jgi:hypothetical protein
MSENAPKYINTELLSAEGRWLIRLRWCKELLTKAIELEKAARATQRELDVRSYKEHPVIDIFEQNVIDMGLPNRRIRLAPRQTGDTYFGINEVHILFPIISWVKEDEDSWQLIFLRITHDEDVKTTYMVTNHSFESVDNLSEEEVVQKMTDVINQPNPDFELTVSPEDLEIVRSLRDVICEPTFKYGIGSLAAFQKADE